MPVNYRKLLTEAVNHRTTALDQLPIEKILRAMNREDAAVPQAVAKVIPQISKAAGIILKVLEKGGRLFFTGAGTSGRLAVMEAAECPPTFHTPPTLVQAVMAGGRSSVFKSKEGAEDGKTEARREIRKRVHPGDVVVGIAASGVTPFVEEALREAKRIGAKSILVTCNPKIHLKVDALIAVRTGPEILSGSTRLKAATATKLILNMLTVASMVKLGKVYGNRMVDLMPRSRKLKERAIRLIEEIGKVSPALARQYFKKANGRAKLAILMARKKISRKAALSLLKNHRGFLRACLP